MTSTLEPRRLLDDDHTAPELKSVLHASRDDDPSPEQLSTLDDRLRAALGGPQLPMLAAPTSKRSSPVMWVGMAAAVMCVLVVSALLLVLGSRSGDDATDPVVHLEPVTQEIVPQRQKQTPQALLGEGITKGEHGSTSPTSFEDVLEAYRRGSFEEAMQRAQHHAQSATSAFEGQKARTLEQQIHRFTAAWSTATASSKQRQKLSSLELALRLDRQISGGHFASKIEGSLRQLYLEEADREWQAKQYASSCQSALRASKLDHSDRNIEKRVHRCEVKAREFLELGERIAARDIIQAKSYWRKVVNMVPWRHPVYAQAHHKLAESEQTDAASSTATAASPQTSAIERAKQAVLRGDNQGCIDALEGAPRTPAVVRILWYCYYNSGKIYQACALGKAYRHHLNVHQQQAMKARCR